MRTLCLNLHKTERPGVAENFLVFSPQVHFREPQLVFLDISRTAHLFGGEDRTLSEALTLSREFFPGATAAISNSPATAQVFTTQFDSYISNPVEERQDVYGLPLRTLTQLEGLIAWQSVREVENIVHFFELLGLKQIGDILKFDVESFRERWGQTGALMWKRLHGLEKQIISPLLPTESLNDFVHLDFPVSLAPFLLHCVERSLKGLFARLQGRGEFARKLLIHLYCEYSDSYHLIELEPATPNRNLELYMKLVEHKISDLDLENPIRDFEVEIVSCPERIQQLDFWQPRVSDREKLQQLMSVFQQAQVTTGFIRPKDEILPEESWELTPEFESFNAIEDELSLEGQSFRLRPAHSQTLGMAPRPSRLLNQPKRLKPSERRRLQFLSQHPIERLEEGWWDSSRGRDYYFAISAQGQLLWVYHDRIEDEYYLHGYFD